MAADGVMTSSQTPSPRIGGWRKPYAFLRFFYGTKLYRLTLGGRGAAPTGHIPADMWPGDATRGDTIVSGDFEFAGNAIRDAEAPWLAHGVSADWLALISTFDWLRDLHAVGGETARLRGQALILRWIDSHGEWNHTAWLPGVLGARIANWIGHCEFLTGESDMSFRQAFFRNMSRQIRHLRRVAPYAAPGSARILALKGLIFASVAFENGKLLERSLSELNEEIERQILGDGGTVMRNPSCQFDYLRHMIDIRSALRNSQQEVPHWVQTTIDRMAPMLRFFRHGDGGLALFNDSREEQGWLIDVVLTRSEARGKPLESAPHSGFERLTADRTSIIMDVGAPPPKGYDSMAHAEALSFEMSVGKERLVVNCGAHHGDSSAWITPQRTTAAHSTVTVEDVNSAEILEDGGFNHRPVKLSVDRKEADGDTWIEATHEGYQRAFGLVHSRRLYLGANGGDIRGEDNLTGKGNHKFVVRFHLHPDVRASWVQEGNAVLLRVPSGLGWRFRASGGVMALQESVYLGSGTGVKRTEQIAISSATQLGTGQVKWAFSRLPNEP
jgi:uncharacterized heparinase superfamily protein